MLISDSQRLLDSRRSLGNRAIELAFDGEDFDTAAKDVISDILTARFGPAGKLVDVINPDGRARVELDREAVENATALVDDALQSYFGDAEDYAEEYGDVETDRSAELDKLTKYEAFLLDLRNEARYNPGRSIYAFAAKIDRLLEEA